MGGKRLAHSVMLMIAVLSLYSAVTEKYLWPFAPYDMYSTTGTRTCSQYYLEGETVAGRRISLSSGYYLHPFGNRELVFKIFPPLLGDGDDKRARLDQRLRDLARHYEERRQSGKHKGPPLVAIRLYRVTWKLAPGAVNLRRPERKTLLREIRW